jgi:hypothetical protein
MARWATDRSPLKREGMPPNLAPGVVTNTGVVSSVQTLIRNARLVPVAGVPAPTDEPLDLRVVDGIVTDVAERLAPELDDEVFDAAGRWAVPGLWDHHVHMSQWADVASRLDMSGTHAPEEVVARVARHIDTLDPRDESVVSGYGHRTGTWTRLPTVAELDAVSGQHPVVLISGDAHHGWLNSAALSLLGVPPRQTTLDENDWFPVFARLGDLPGAGLAHKLALREVVRDAAARGVVGVTDLEFGGAYLDWPERFAQGVDSLRVRAATYAEGLAEVVAAGLRTGDDLAETDGLLQMGPLKIISDGSLNTRTAYCCTQYPDGHLLEYPQGRLNNSPEELVELFTTAHRNGLRVALHAIGDAALSLGLDAFSATGARGGIEHAQLVDLADLPRMAELGVRASVQPAHLLDDRDVTERCWPERTDRCFAFRSMLTAGVELVLGSDAPVAALDPWLAMSAAVHRTADARAPWHPEQALTAAEALAASTDGQPTLRPGSRGDVVLLDHDPLAPYDDSGEVGAHLREVEVAATFVAGRPTHLAL